MKHVGCVRVVVTAALAAATLTGCSNTVERGQTPFQAAAAAETIPGVAAAEIVSEDVSIAPFDYARNADVYLTLEPGWVVDDAPDLLRWVVMTGWSLNDAQIDYSLTLWLDSPDGHPDADWEAAAFEIGISEDWTGAETYDEHGFLNIWPDDMLAVAQGPWPADPPVTPTNAFARVDSSRVAP